MTREQKMQAAMGAIRATDAALEALRVVLYGGNPDTLARLGTARSLLDQAMGHMQTLAALDAHTEAVVTLAVWRAPTGAVSLYKPGTVGDKPTPGWTRLATVTLPLDREGGE